MDDISLILRNGFNIKTNKITKNKSSFICNTNKGLIKLSKTTLSKEELVFQHNIKMHLLNSNFDDFDKFFLSVFDEPFYKIGKETYVLTKFATYPAANFNLNTDFLNIIKKIGLLHSNLININFSDEKIFGNINILEEYNKNRSIFVKHKKKITKFNNFNDFDIYLIKNFDYYLTEIDYCIDYLKNNEIKNNIDKENVFVCHCKLKEENILYNKTNIFIEDFSEAKIQNHIFDLGFVIKRYINSKPERLVNINEILENYFTYYTDFDKNEIKKLYPILKFPISFLNICNDYYSKKRSWAPNIITSRLNSLIENKKEYDDYIENLLII